MLKFFFNAFQCLDDEDEGEDELHIGTLTDIHGRGLKNETICMKTHRCIEMGTTGIESAT